jgi:hypothetical protein
MPYHQEQKSLFETIQHISQLDERMPAIRQLFEHEIQAFTIDERFELLHDLSKLKQVASGFSGYEEKYDYFFNKIIGANKVDYLEANHFASYQLTGADVVAISEHYFKQGINIYIENRVLERRDIRIHRERHAVNEMLHIQSALSEDEYAGYIYTNGAGTGRAHFEAFIIGSEIIIKPIRWCVDLEYALELNSYIAGQTASTSLFSFCGLPDIPQGGNMGCGSLSVSYLKNYLKDNARQMKELTLCIPYYCQQSKATEIRYFFFPSPHVLRYSESERYNKVLESMLELDGSFAHKDKHYSIKSLVSLLQNTIHQAELLGHTQIIHEAQSLVEYLPDFRKKWLSHYQPIREKRQQMQASEHNMYLAYTSQRMNRIAKIFEQDRSNPGLAVLKAFEKKLSDSISSVEIILFLKQEMSKIKFNSMKEIGYFFGKVGDNFYIYLFDIIPSGLIKYSDEFRQCCVFLTPAQIKGLIEYVKKPENFNRLVLERESVSMRAMISWLKCLRVPKSDTASFFKQHLTTEWLQSKLKFSLVTGVLKNLRDVFLDQQVLAIFLREYISMTSIAELVPDFFRNSNLSFIEPMFVNTEELSVFLITHLEPQFIQDTLLAIQDAYKLQIIIADYIDLFGEDQFSVILYKMVGNTVLLHLLARSHRWLLEMLNQYSSVEETREFFIINRDCIIKAIIKAESIYPFNLHRKLQHAIQSRLDFFCPEDHPELMALYKEKFILLLQTEQNSDDVKPSLGKLKYFVKELIDFIPESQRYIFIERIFEYQDIEAILTLECIAELFPKKREPISVVTINHDSLLASTDVSDAAQSPVTEVSITALTGGQSMFSANSASLNLEKNLEKAVEAYYEGLSH